MERQINFPEEFPILKGDRIDLKAISPDDVEAFYKLRSDKEFMKYLGRHPMKNMSEARERVSSMIEDFKRGNAISWKISLEGEDDLIGYISFWKIDSKHYKAEIGFGIDTEYQQQGIMSEAMPLILKYGFEELGLHSILADVDPANEASRQVLEKSGFKQEAHIRENFYFNGRFIDSIYYGILENDIRD